MLSPRLPLFAGLLVHATILALAVVFGVRVAGPLAEIGTRVLSGVDAERDSDLVARLPTTEGLRVGLPAYVIDADGGGRPVAHVVDWSSAGDVRLRFAPGEEGAYRVRVFPPRRGLADAYALAVPPDTAAEITDVLRARVTRFWEETLREDVQSRLPAFVKRIDPRAETDARRTLEALGDEAMRRLRPHVDDLVQHVAGAVNDQLSVWDRLGVLWNMVRGDEKRLERKIAPVAEKAAQRWWQANQDEVLTSLGQALEARLPAVRRWLEGEVLTAAREELVEPLLVKHEKRLQGEGEALVRLVLDRVVRAPAGGFQVRFAAMLRHVLLDKQTALLVLEPLEVG